MFVVCYKCNYCAASYLLQGGPAFDIVTNLPTSQYQLVTTIIYLPQVAKQRKLFSTIMIFSAPSMARVSANWSFCVFPSNDFVIKCAFCLFFDHLSLLLFAFGFNLRIQ